MKDKRPINDSSWKSITKKTAIIFFLLIGCTIHVTFANTDMHTLIREWFNSKTEESVQTMETELNLVKEKQMNRIQSEIRAQMEEVNQSLDQLVNQQIAARTVELEQYADGIMEELSTSETSPITNNQEEIQSEMDAIMKSAIAEMELVKETITKQDNSVKE